MLQNRSINGVVNREVEPKITGVRGEFTGIKSADIEGVEIVKKPKKKLEGYIAIETTKGLEEGYMYKGKTIEGKGIVVKNKEGELVPVTEGVEVVKVTRTKRNGKNIYGVVVDGRVREIDKTGKNDLKKLIGKGIELFKDDIAGIFTLEELSKYCNELGMSTEVTLVPKSKTETNPEGERRLSIRGRDLKHIYVGQSPRGVDCNRVSLNCRYRGTLNSEELWFYKYETYEDKGVKGIANEIYKLAKLRTVKN